MVVKPFSHLARQSFGKTFAHGYAQSVVAATQSSYASTTTPFAPFSSQPSNRSGRPTTAQAHAFQNAPGSFAGSVHKGPGGSSQSSEIADSGLSAYFEAWQKQQLLHGDSKGWKQFQFAKRIGWKPASATEDEGKTKIEQSEISQDQLSHIELERSYSTSAVDDIKKAEDAAAEVEAVAKVDQAIAEEIHSIKQAATINDTIKEVSSPASQGSAISGAARSGTLSSPSPESSVEALTPSTSVSDVKSTSPVQDEASQAYSRHLGELHESGSYSQIPSVFESMLTEGLKPNNQAYNALLAAAIHSSPVQHQVIPKALDVYADALRRKVLPDTYFYGSLINLLSGRALDVSQRKNILQQKQKRFGGLSSENGFIFAFLEAENAILAEDDALENAAQIFERSIRDTARTFSAETYEIFVNALAVNGSVERMVQAFTHMETQGVKPTAGMFAPMIEAFAGRGDLSSAVETYNEYKTLAMDDDAGKFVLVNRRDNEVYAAVVKAYSSCGKMEGGQRFATRIVDSFSSVTNSRKERLENVQDTIILDAMVSHQLDAQNFSAAFKIAEEQNLSNDARTRAMSRICIASADHSDLDIAQKAYSYLTSAQVNTTAGDLAILSLHLRLGHIDAARESWSVLKSRSGLNASCVEPTTFYVTALIQSGRVDEALFEVRQAFDRIRASASSPAVTTSVTDHIDEAIELLVTSVSEAAVKPSPNAGMNLVWAMAENGGLLPCAEKMLANFGPEDITNLDWHNMVLALQVEAGLIANADARLDIAHSARFAHILDICLQEMIPFDERSLFLIQRAIASLPSEFGQVAKKWQDYQRFLKHRSGVQASVPPSPIATPTHPGFSTENQDPYAATTDFKGSAMVVEELESRRNSQGLNEALMKFRNIRRGGRHPRFLAYAKLIAAAAREGRYNLTHDILGMARKDVPFVPGMPLVLQGWVSILDAMVGACLTTGRRAVAEQFHQELLSIGAAPTANTYGLYITTLKESVKTFDEATEAVTIFNRALSEGVSPSSFLYNALIGKLGKARRIDDCLRYFQEMRTAGIRPTSVTYGTVVNALCRVSDERFAEELFDEMESQPNYKPRPAPYNSLMQFFLTTKRDSAKVLAYYERMRAMNIQPTMHTFKLLIDTHATLDPIDLGAAEAVLDTIRSTGQKPEAVHYASLIHAKGCVLHDMEGSRRVFDQALKCGVFAPSACLYQALFESMVANHCVAQTEPVLDSMSANRVEMTPYIANTLIHGWATENQISRSKAIFDSVGVEKREPSTYEAMTRAYLTVEDRDSANAVVHEMLSRGYPSAVANKVLELVGHGNRSGSVA